MTIAPERTSARTLVAPELFDRLVARVAAEHEFTHNYAERIVDQALAFLGAAAANRHDTLVPSEAVDIGWHTFILYTREYAEFCAQVAHRFIHHVPDDAPGTVERRGDPIEVRTRTLEAIERAGYLVDPELWGPVSGKCGPCHEDGNCAASGKDGDENTENRKKAD